MTLCPNCCRREDRCTCTTDAQPRPEPKNLFGISWAITGDEDPNETEIRMFGDDTVYCARCHWEIDACVCNQNSKEKVSD